MIDMTPKPWKKRSKKDRGQNMMLMVTGIVMMVLIDFMLDINHV